MTQQHLFIAQIGPVQSFIASARKVRDLIVGSYTLSALARAGIEYAQDAGASLIVPAELPSRDIHNGIPHRFIFTHTCTPQEAKQLIEEIEQVIHTTWHHFADQVRYFLENDAKQEDNGWVAEYEEQLKEWFSFYGVAVPMVGCYKDTIKQANRAMASRKQSRTFTVFPTRQEGNGQREKCQLSGDAPVLSLKWEQLHKRFGESNISKYGDESKPSYEKLGGIATFKRFATFAGLPYLSGISDQIADTDTIAGFDDKAPEKDGRTTEKYFAVLRMDGDKMGERVKDLKDSEEHKEFSRKLLEFATQHVAPLVDGASINPKDENGNVDPKKQRAILIYAGGDDVLALLPLESMFEIAQKLYEKFVKKVGGTASAGLAIAHYKYPLDRVLHASHEAEQHAKKQLNRNAIAITETTSGGQVRQTGGKWHPENAPKLLDVIVRIQLAFTSEERGGEGILSASIAYDMRDVYEALVGDDMREARRLEFLRLLKRRTTSAQHGDAVQQLGEELVTIAEAIGWERLSNWLILARFLAQHAGKHQEMAR